MITIDDLTITKKGARFKDESKEREEKIIKEQAKALYNSFVNQGYSELTAKSEVNASLRKTADLYLRESIKYSK
jgi:hypothetical protein